MFIVFVGRPRRGQPPARSQQLLRATGRLRVGSGLGRFAASRCPSTDPRRSEGGNGRLPARFRVLLIAAASGSIGSITSPWRSASRSELSTPPVSDQNRADTAIPTVPRRPCCGSVRPRQPALAEPQAFTNPLAVGMNRQPGKLLDRHIEQEHDRPPLELQCVIEQRSRDPHLGQRPPETGSTAAEPEHLARRSRPFPQDGGRPSSASRCRLPDRGAPPPARHRRGRARRAPRLAATGGHGTRDDD